MKKFLLLLILPWPVFAQSGGALPSQPPGTTPVASNRFAQEVSQVTQQKMRNLGFAANDPRYGATLDAMSKKAAERSLQFKSTHTAMVPSATPSSWGTAVMGSISNFFGGVSGFFSLSFVDPAGPFGWTYCPGDTGKAQCLLSKYGVQLPPANPINAPGNLPFLAPNYCVVNSHSGSGNLPLCPGVEFGTPSTYLCAASPMVAAMACTGVGKSYPEGTMQPSFPITYRWRPTQNWPALGTADEHGYQQTQMVYQYHRDGYDVNPYWAGSENSAVVVVPFLNLPTGVQPCPAGKFWSPTTSSCAVPNPSYYGDDGLIEGPPDFPENITLPQAIDDLQATPLVKPNQMPASETLPYGDNQMSAWLSPELSPYFINDLWKDVADDPDYAGLPYPENNPVRQPDVDAYRQQYPDYIPRVGDLFQPMPNPSNLPDPSISPNPWQIPTGSPSPTQNPNPVSPPGSGTNPQPDNVPDLGPDPGIGEPELEPIPEPVEILRPLFELFPDLKSYTVPQHTGVCPTAHIQIPYMNVDTVMTSHCDILDQNKSTIYGIMLLVWGVLAMLIILRA